MFPQTAPHAIENIVREEWGRLLAILIGAVGDFQLAEDCLQEALLSALDHWARNGVPNSPAGWLLKVARRKAIDRIRRSQNFQRKQAEYSILLEQENQSSSDMEIHEIPDERLRLIFACCHPALDEKSRVALTLRTLGGLETAMIARAFVMKEQAMAQRLVRAKRKIKLAGIPYAVPGSDQWDERLSSVLGVLYLIFNEGYSASLSDHHSRLELFNEAIQLARGMDMLRPQDPEIEGLLSLMLLHHSRVRARIDKTGDFVPLEFQDRQLWDRRLIEEGKLLVRQALARGRAAPYQIQAAISAVHAEASDFENTGWDEIVLLYDELREMQSNPVVALNRAVAVSYANSCEVALAALDELHADLTHYQPFHAAKADILRRAGRVLDAAVSYREAIRLSTNAGERQFLGRRLKQVAH